MDIQPARHGRYSQADARALLGLGATWTGAGETRKAQKHLELSLAIQEAQGGPEDRLLLQTVSALGALYVHAGDYHRAGDSLRRSLAIQERILPGDWAQRGKIL